MEDIDTQADYFKLEMPKIVNLFTQTEINKFLNFMTTYFYQYFNIFEVCMTKFIDFNVFSRNFFAESLENPSDLAEGTKSNPANNPLLEDYLPENELMKE